MKNFCFAPRHRGQMKHQSLTPNINIEALDHQLSAEAIGHQPSASNKHRYDYYRKLTSITAPPPAQADSSPNGTNGHSKAAVVHLLRSNRLAKCGVDVRYHAALATTKIAATSCRNCLRAHQADAARRRIVSTWKRKHRSAKVKPAGLVQLCIALGDDSKLKQSAGIRSGGLVDLETAIQKAVEVVEMRHA